jgi:hypothetical protein
MPWNEIPNLVFLTGGIFVEVVRKSWYGRSGHFIGFTQIPRAWRHLTVSDLPPIR